MREQNFGIEIEMTGITRNAAAKIIARHFGTEAVHVGGTYDAYAVRDDQDRRWKVVRDSSIRCQARGQRSASALYGVEFVSPVCKYEDIPTIQELVRELRHAGAMVNDSCGIHVHVDASRHDPKTLRNVVNIMASKEDLLYKTLKVNIDRAYYCQKADLRFLDDVNLKRPKSMSEFETIWYNGESGRHTHYHSSRYHALNLHSVFSKGTIPLGTEEVKPVKPQRALWRIFYRKPEMYPFGSPGQISPTVDGRWESGFGKLEGKIKESIFKQEKRTVPRHRPGLQRRAMPAAF